MGPCGHNQSYGKLALGEGISVNFIVCRVCGTLGPAQEREKRTHARGSMCGCRAVALQGLAQDSRVLVSFCYSDNALEQHREIARGWW